MAKVSAIQAQLDAAAGRKVPPPSPTQDRQPPVAEIKAAKAPSRAGRVHIGAYLPADFKRSLMLVRAQTGQDVQSLVAKALNDLFRAHNVPVIGQD
jgi:hypothetical protein